ncbi:class I SAM-dependent methyltransferase [Virgibacillus sp. NKC19-3]|uniref:class I SAM-dependent methyltransferase n=1 Tax=Virgibacillus saliphilus TaxID=2831674 RepID=UPI001C9AF891|nr:class I SAM-dependent methyltransferase [Virgibacillus sp. NKC19-3]MBY7143944.1 class I SAM-dependent methyltransferase [Virgibacillus sp. NKC19-3]
MKQNIYDNATFFKNYTALRASGINYNNFVEQPAIKSIISSLKGKSVLDLGCGDGHFSKYCIENGAESVIGVDISNNMIDRAKRINKDNHIEFLCMPMEDLKLSNQKFDLIISSLSIHYVEDYAELVRKINRLLKTNGEFIFSTEHPIVTARKGNNHWIKTKEGHKLHWAFDNYQEEGMREHDWYVDGVVVYHRTISTLINTLIESGLVLDEIIEPQSTSAGLKQMPKLINEKRRPSFIIIKSKKQN